VHRCGIGRRRPGHAAASLLHEEDKAGLQKAPWASGFSGNFENCTSFARFCDTNKFKKLRDILVAF
jgi:hypothetical protein